MIRSVRLAALGAAITAALGVSLAYAQEASQTKIPTSNINRMTAVYSTEQVECTTELTSLLTQKIKTKKKGNVATHFQGEFGSGNGCNVNILLRLDGKTINGPGNVAQGNDIVAQSSLGTEGTRGFVWAIKGVTAGKHTLEVLCLCDVSNMKVSEREAIFYHR
jgi:hypothetical protein